VATACSWPLAGARASAGAGPETVGVEADGHGIPVDAQLRAAERLWAIGDVNGVWPLTYVGKYQGDVPAANILGKPREAHYAAVPRVVFTDPQACSGAAARSRRGAYPPGRGRLDRPRR
jgi:dihydrolipoamide dehydrogenase